MSFEQVTRSDDEVAKVGGELPGLIDLDALIRSAYELEPLPQSVPKLAALAVSETANVNDISEIVSYDQVLTAKVLRAANSAYASRGIPITTVSSAIVRIGRGMVLSLAIASSIRTRVQKSVPAYGLREGELWNHSVMAGLAADMAKQYCKVPIPPECFTASILHDIGKLVLARFLHPSLAEALNRVEGDTGRRRADIETEFLDVHNGEVGALVAQHWKLPECIVEGIMHHGRPNAEHPTVCHVVHLSNSVAEAIEGRKADSDFQPKLNKEVVKYLGITREGFDKLCNSVADEFESTLDKFS